jgi:hypothetical protein
MYARSIANVFLVVLRVPVIIIMAQMYFFMHFFKYLLGVPAIIRWMERTIDHFLMKNVIATFGYFNFKKTNHREHKNWSWEAA